MSELLPGWTVEQVAGHPADVFRPKRRHPEGRVVVYLHGVHLGRLVNNPHATQLLASQGVVCVAPVTGRCWWLDLPCPDFAAGRTPEAHVREHVIPWIAAEFGQEPPLVGLLGTSMGGQGAIRLALKYPDVFPVASAIAPAVDFHTWMQDGDETLAAMFPSVEAARQETAILKIQALKWPRHLWFCCDPQDERWWDSADKLNMKLESMGVPHEYDLETSAGGHGWDYYNTMFEPALAAVLDGLEKESRRIV